MKNCLLKISAQVISIKQILEIVVVTLIKTKYIKSIKHNKHGVLLQDPKSMEIYFKESLKGFKDPSTYQLPLILTESY